MTTTPLTTEADPTHLDIGQAELTINEWSRQTNIQVLFDFQIVKGIWTNAVQCDCTPEESLRLLLRHLGLVFDFVNPRTVAVTRGVQSGGPASPPVLPTPEQYQKWFDRAELYEPARSYGYDLNIQGGKVTVILPSEQENVESSIGVRNSLVCARVCGHLEHSRRGGAHEPP